MTVEECKKLLDKRFEAALKCISDIESYFEYDGESTKDKEYVLFALDKFTLEMEKLNEQSRKWPLGKSIGR